MTWKEAGVSLSEMIVFSEDQLGRKRVQPPRGYTGNISGILARIRISSEPKRPPLLLVPAEKYYRAEGGDRRGWSRSRLQGCHQREHCGDCKVQGNGGGLRQGDCGRQGHAAVEGKTRRDGTPSLGCRNQPPPNHRRRGMGSRCTSLPAIIPVPARDPRARPWGTTPRSTRERATGRGPRRPLPQGGISSRWR